MSVRHSRRTSADEQLLDVQDHQHRLVRMFGAHRTIENGRAASIQLRDGKNPAHRDFWNVRQFFNQQSKQLPRVRRAHDDDVASPRALTGIE